MNTNVKTIKMNSENLKLITLENSYLKVVISTFGAAIFHIYLKNKNKYHEVTVQPNNLEEFMYSDFYYGKTVGRVSGRLFPPGYIIKDNFHKQKKENILHSGKSGFSFSNFDVVSFSKDKLILEAVSFEKDSGFPGDLRLNVIYEIENRSLRVRYLANASKSTLCNITNHVYFNLSQEKDIYNHEIKVDSKEYLEIDKDNRIIGKKNIINSKYDLSKKINMRSVLEKMSNTPFKGLDHTFLLNKKCVNLFCNEFSLEVKTSYPAIVIYSHNKKSPHSLLQKEFGDNEHSSIALECQFEPGGVQHEGLNKGILDSKEKYNHFILYTFKIDNI